MKQQMSIIEMNYSFEQESALHQHKEYVHENNAPHKCELCHEGFDGFFFQKTY